MFAGSYNAPTARLSIPSQARSSSSEKEEASPQTTRESALPHVSRTVSHGARAHRQRLRTAQSPSGRDRMGARTSEQAKRHKQARQRRDSRRSARQAATRHD